MTDQEVKEAFTEVYNKFWLRYRNAPLSKDSDEWERMNTWATVLMKKYPFMKLVIAEMITELGQRMWRHERG